ncbi:MAG: ABC transporter substrate-binding protein, partial [Gammaproteobacteria bacterium]|nr:ABC transporter substrate-binding protein [Gammaproteobacteria bacterium]
MKSPNLKKRIHPLCTGIALAVIQLGISGAVLAADCPTATVAEPKGVPAGQFPQQYELAEFESLAKCKLSFKGNPDAAALNKRIYGNPKLPSLAERLPEEPLVVAPYDSIGKYGGTFDMLSNATESGTSDMMAVRHVNLVRYSDDLETIVPNVAKGWEWNDDFTQLTFFLRKGQKWSDGAPFGAEDVEFWYENLAIDTNVREKPKDYVLVGGKPMSVDVIDAQTVRFNLPSPKPGLLSHFANHYAQGFQPKHFLGQWHPAVSSDADAKAQALGFENGYAAIAAYYGSSDWMDTPTPMLTNSDKLGVLPLHAHPTLESHIVIAESTEGRHFVANPYFYMVDTAGNQLPYINEQDELFINNAEVRLLKLMNGEVSFKQQALNLDHAPVLLENQEKSNFTVVLKPEVAMSTFAFNVTSEDLEKRKVFGDLRFRQAMSVAINRDEINEVVFFGTGTTQQYIGFSPTPSFVDEKWTQHYAQFDPKLANKLLKEMGMKDVDGDGFLDLLDGSPLVLNLQVATQSMSIKQVELIGQHWAAVGINNTVKEVTTDEFRSAMSSNQLDVTMYLKGQPLAVILGISELFIPPYDNYFNQRTAMLWGEYLDSDGASGVKPPPYAYEMIEDISAFQAATAGTAESNRMGSKLVKT